MNLAENIYRLRTQRNLSQGDLANALEVSRQSVSKWENNSAVPELEKLMKMAEIFGATLDELVTGIPPESSTLTQQEPKVIYIEKTTRPGITTSQILGIILLSCSLIALVLSFFFVEPNNWWDSPFVLCLPVAVFGIICIAVKRHPYYFCALAAYLLVWLLVTVLMTSHYGTTAWLVRIGLILFGIALLAYIIIRFQSLQIPAIAKVVIAVCLGLSLLIGIVAMIPAAKEDAITGNEYSGTLDASVSPD